MRRCCLCKIIRKPTNYRALTGTQAVIRYSDDESRILAVCHFFDKPDELKITLCGNYEIDSALYGEECTVHDGVLTVKGGARCAAVLILKKV